MATGLTLRDSGNLENMSKIVVASAIANVEPAGPTNQLVSRYDIPAGNKSVTVPVWTRNDAAALTEGVDIAVPQQMDANTTSLTAGEHGILIFVSDRLKHQNNEDIMGHVGEVQGNALGRLLDQDLIGLFASFSKQIVNSGSSETQGTVSDIAASISYLRTNNDASYGPSYGELNGVFHPEQIRRFALEAAGIGPAATAPAVTGGTTYQGGMSEEVFKNYYRGNFGIFGVNIFEDGNITATANNSAIAAIFQREAIALAMESEMTAEEERDASLRGTEIVMTGTWGQSILIDPWGVEFYSSIAAGS